MSTSPISSPDSSSTIATPSRLALRRENEPAGYSSGRRGTNVPSGRRRRSPVPTSTSATACQRGPSTSRVGGLERRLVRGAEQVGGVELLVLVVEDRGLDRALEELVRVAAEELVECVVARDVDRQPAPAAARPAPHLAQRGDGAREGHADRGVERADVDPELQRVRRHDAEQVAADQPRLELAPLLRRVAGPVGRDPRGELRLPAALQLEHGEARHQLDGLARLHEHDRPRALDDEAGEQVGGLGERRAARLRRGVGDRRVPHRDRALGARRAVARDDRHVVEARQPRGQLARVGDRRRREQEARGGAVQLADPPQPPQHVGDVRAEDAAVDVGLVDHDHREVLEEVAPGGVVGQDPEVQHVRVGQDHVGPRGGRRRAARAACRRRRSPVARA